MNRRIKYARLLITVPAVFLAIVPPLADFNSTHVANPLWPPHARLHTVWLICTNSSIALLALAVLWARSGLPSRKSVLLAAALTGAILLGFFAAAATQSAYGGALTDSNGIPFRIGPLDANLAAFSALAVIVVVAAGVVRERSP